MPTQLGAHSARLRAICALQTTKGRRESGRFAFEGPTLLHEAIAAGTRIAELYVTQAAYDAQPAVRMLESSGVPTFIVDARAAAKISDLESAPGILAVAEAATATPARLLSNDGIVLALADLNDPGNVGTLMRTAQAFGAAGIVAGRLGADPYQPKVVRAAMGAVFRLPIARADPAQLSAAAARSGRTVIGLAPAGASLEGFSWPAHCVVVVGGERRGLGRWKGACSVEVAIPMRASADGLNAAVAGSIALYEAVKGMAPKPP
jgi:RNA methyltransferase, TrmH family